MPTIDFQIIFNAFLIALSLLFVQLAKIVKISEKIRIFAPGYAKHITCLLSFRANQVSQVIDEVAEANAKEIHKPEKQTIMADIILGIESSCDDTSAAVIKDGYLMSNVLASQDVHKAYGGVIPELASRAHQVNIVPVVSEAITRAGIKPSDITASEVSSFARSSAASDFANFHGARVSA